MVKTASTMLPLGTQAPLFSLQDVTTGKQVTLEEKASFAATVIMFICNHCPYVKHINAQLTRLAEDYIPRNVQFIAINSNDTQQYPDDSPQNMKQIAREQHYPFPYLFDETQEVARAYQASCTPDFFVFGKSLRLEYRGQFDDSRPGHALAVTGQSIRSALDNLLAGQPVSGTQKPSIGCNIKWKKD